ARRIGKEAIKVGCENDSWPCRSKESDTGTRKGTKGKVIVTGTAVPGRSKAHCMPAKRHMPVSRSKCIGDVDANYEICTIVRSAVRIQDIIDAVPIPFADANVAVRVIKTCELVSCSYHSGDSCALLAVSLRMIRVCRDVVDTVIDHFCNAHPFLVISRTHRVFRMFPLIVVPREAIVTCRFDVD